MVAVRVPLANNRGFAHVSVRDMSVLRFRWNLMVSMNTSYAAHSFGHKTVLLHRYIMQPQNGDEVHHKDGNGLNCTRSNMETLTKVEHRRRTARKRPKSGFIGVRLNGKRWQAFIHRDGHQVPLGTFDTPEQAAEAHDAAVVERDGENAILNTER